MTVEPPSAHEDDRRARTARILRLAQELVDRGHDVTVHLPRHQPPTLHTNPLTHPRHQRVILCAGAEGTYVFLDHHGHILGTADPPGTIQVAVALSQPPEA